MKRYCRVKKGEGLSKRIPVFVKPRVVATTFNPNASVQMPDIIDCEFLYDKRYEIINEVASEGGIFVSSHDWLIKPENQKKTYWFDSDFFEEISQKELHNEKFMGKFDKWLNDG